jgi:membrane protease YdiL (CAAX protease family)
MHFDKTKPLHIVSLVILIVVCLYLFLEPILTYTHLLPTVSGVTDFQIYLTGFILSLLIFIGTPVLWYTLVNSYTIHELLAALKLRSKGIDQAFLWGILAAVCMFIVAFIIDWILLYYHAISKETVDTLIQNAGEITVISMILVTIYAITAEIFFRGFLLEKLDSFAGRNISILITALLYGIIHLSIGNITPIIIPILFGVILGFTVTKTKNLYSVIIAQIIYNFVILILVIVTQTLHVETTVI